MFIADLHIHSHYSRATSKNCVPEQLAFWARRKGIAVVGTGDFTHPGWREELKEKLVPGGEGLYVLKDSRHIEDEVAGADWRPQFVVSGEISSIYKKNGKVRKIHNLVLLPGLEQAEALARRLEAIGNVRSDGRPILGLDSRDLLEIVLDVCPEAVFIPAHIWTPHFSLFGAYSGFDAIEECFEDLTGHIYALETGLSSNPPMNWRLSALDRFTLVSNSDAHSPANLGREANIFDTEVSYTGMRKALQNRGGKEFRGTLEFFPEEGKYHYDGHRKCRVCWRPAETRAAGGVCPVCGGKITVGVLHRVEDLADRAEGFVPPAATPFESLVPLCEVIASATGASAAGKKVREKYEHLLRELGPELFILREAPLGDIELAAGPCVAEGIRRLRCGRVEIHPGFDGEYGKIKVMDKSEIDVIKGQLCLFADRSAYVKKPSKPAPGRDLPVPAAEETAAAQAGEAAPPYSSERAKTAAAATAAAAPYGLNEEQWAAVSSTAPVVAVTAGPGTGKTRTLISRIAYLVETRGVPPSQITAVTFTNKAAGEMRARLEEHFGDRRAVENMTIGTFHSICLQLLSTWHGRNKIAIIDEYTALSILAELVKELAPAVSPREALRTISLLKNGASPANAAEGLHDLYAAYCSRLKQYGVLDYDDLLLAVLHRFESEGAGGAAAAGTAGSVADSAAGNTAGNAAEKDARRAPGSPFTCLLVDEFQDINELQYRLIRAWGRQSESIFIIGDPDQSIYGFRGSHARYFARFAGDFPGLRQFRLTRNYRSTPEIIGAATAVITRQEAGAAQAAGGGTRYLHAQRAGGAKIRLVEMPDAFSEALFVAKEINRLVGGMDMLEAQAAPAPGRKRRTAGHARSFADIAVLYRVNRQAEILEQCLSKEGIPYTVAGRDEFLAEKPVFEALAFFRFLLHPGDITALLVCLEAFSPHGAAINRAILERYLAGEQSVSSLAALLAGAGLPRQKSGRPRDFAEMMWKYEPIIVEERPWEIVSSWIEDHELSGARCMELLLHTSIMYDDMPSFVHNLVLGRESDVTRSGGKVYSPEAVSLMTVHAAKGLEFPVVFICGVNDGLIPLKGGSPGLEVDADEERRLFYVGMTRAQDELILLTSGTPSPYLAAIGDGQLVREKISTPRQESRFRQVSLFD